MQTQDAYAGLPRVKARMVVPDVKATPSGLEASGEVDQKAIGQTIVETRPGEVITPQLHLESPESSFEIPLYAWILGLLLAFFLGIGWLWRKVKKLILSLVWMGLCGFGGQALAADGVQAYLSSPSPGAYYSLGSESSFDQLWIRGGMIDESTGEGILASGTPQALQVLLNDGTGDQFIPLDLGAWEVSSDQTQFQIRMPLESLVEGAAYDFTLELVYSTQVYSLPLLDGDGNNAKIHLDSTPPDLSLTFPGGQGVLQNTPVIAAIHCEDAGSGCEGDLQHPTWSVAGNFCEDSLTCNANGVRTLEMCDKADNCQNIEISLDWYDPIPPSFKAFVLEEESYRGVQLTRQEVDRVWSIDGLDKTDLAAAADYDLKLYIDDGLGAFQPHIPSQGAIVLAHDWSDDPEAIDLSDPTIDPGAYPDIDLWCTSEEGARAWCSVREGSPVQDCCLLSIDEVIAQDFDPSIYTAPEALFQLSGEVFRIQDQRCLTLTGEYGIYDGGGYCALSHCPFGFTQGRSHADQNPDKCYFDPSQNPWNL